MEPNTPQQFFTNNTGMSSGGMGNMGGADHQSRKFVFIVILLALLIVVGLVVFIMFGKKEVPQQLVQPNEPALSAEEQLIKNMSAPEGSLLSPAEETEIMERTSAPGEATGLSDDEIARLKERMTVRAF